MEKQGTKKNENEELENPKKKSDDDRRVIGSSGKSCKGCLYYSSLQKSKSKTPSCFGLSTTLHQVPGYIVGETELEASKEGRSLTDFRYACLGYSVFLEKNGLSPNDPQSKHAELPFCVGLEVLLDKRPEGHTQAPAHAHTHTHTHRNEENAQPQTSSIPQSRTYKPPHSAGEEYLSRFKRNAVLVASGMARNVNRVCNHVKESLDDILYPYRRRPK